MRTKIAEYNNGNVHVTRFSDGTVIRYSEDDEFNFAFPENMDVKICDRCDMNCNFCHEGSTPNGDLGNLMTAEWVDTIHPYTEIAIGGGNPLSHPDLIPFLYRLKRNNVFANITVNQIHFMQNIDLFRELRDKELVRGIGISFHHYDEDLFAVIKEFPNAVLHVIAGLLSETALNQLMEHKELKILILGYKKLRRGEEYYNKNLAEALTGYSLNIDWNIGMLKRKIPSMFQTFDVVSFDCLAIEQLSVKDFLPKQVWDRFYQGEDGTMTFYIDMVNNRFSESSTAPLNKRADINSLTVDEMFTVIKNHKIWSSKDE